MANLDETGMPLVPASEALHRLFTIKFSDAISAPTDDEKSSREDLTSSAHVVTA